jgi:hypothetical protein
MVKICGLCYVPLNISRFLSSIDLYCLDLVSTSRFTDNLSAPLSLRNGQPSTLIFPLPYLRMYSARYIPIALSYSLYGEAQLVGNHNFGSGSFPMYMYKVSAGHTSIQNPSFSPSLTWNSLGHCSPSINAP